MRGVWDHAQDWAQVAGAVCGWGAVRAGGTQPGAEVREQSEDGGGGAAHCERKAAAFNLGTEKDCAGALE